MVGSCWVYKHDTPNGVKADSRSDVPLLGLATLKITLVAALAALLLGVGKDYGNIFKAKTASTQSRAQRNQFGHHRKQTSISPY